MLWGSRLESRTGSKARNDANGVSNTCSASADGPTAQTQTNLTDHHTGKAIRTKLEKTKPKHGKRKISPISFYPKYITGNSCRAAGKGLLRANS